MFPESVPVEPTAVGSVREGLDPLLASIHLPPTISHHHNVLDVSSATLATGLATAYNPMATPSYYQAYGAYTANIAPGPPQTFPAYYLPSSVPAVHANGAANYQHSQVVQSSASNSADGVESEEDWTVDKGVNSKKANNTLAVWGNEKTMNLNNLILTNILQSPYFKVTLYRLSTYSEIIDEVWYNVKHLEPWERGSRQVSPCFNLCPKMF